MSVRLPPERWNYLVAKWIVSIPLYRGESSECIVIGSPINNKVHHDIGTIHVTKENDKL